LRDTERKGVSSTTIVHLKKRQVSMPFLKRVFLDKKSTGKMAKNTPMGISNLENIYI
jgi:hypothetical protein